MTQVTKDNDYTADSWRDGEPYSFDHVALRISVNSDIPMKTSTWTGEPPFQGSNGMYEQCGCKMIQIVPALFWNPKNGKNFEMQGELYCDEEGLLTNKTVNWRASQLRKWYLERNNKELVNSIDLHTGDYNIVGDACFVVKASDENIAMLASMEKV